MKRLELFTLLALLLLALDASEASLLARGRSKTKKLRQERPIEASYECLDPPAKLPACNFRDEAEDETPDGKPSRHSRSLDTLPELEELSPFAETPETRRAVTIIYKIEGCIPSRLPFVLPLCKTEDSVRRIVEVRRLFPFKVAAPSTHNSGVLPTFVFPEVDMDQWHRFMTGPWIRPAANDDDAAQSDKVTRQISEVESEIASEIASKKTTKRKKAEEVDTSKKNIQQKYAEEVATPKEIDENDIFSKFPSAAEVEHHRANDRARDTDSYKIRTSRLNRIVDAMHEDGEIGRRVAAKSSPSHLRHEFPYAEAIPYDAEKLRVARVDSEFPFARAIAYDPRNLDVAKIGSEFPYNRAISYDPKNLEEAKIGSEFPYNRAISYDPKNLEEAKIGSEFPYNRAISYDPKNLEEAKIGSEFPYNRAISYDPKNLEEAKIGSEFPYSRAISYDPKNLEEAKIGSEFPYSRAISYDPKNLEEAKIGSEFPYNRAIAYDPLNLEEAKIGSEFPYARAIPYDPRNLQVAKLGSEFPYSRAITYDPEKLQVARVGSEFPYSRAIPYDPAKLQVAKRGSEFPYTRAIPYDPKKLEERRIAALTALGSRPFSSRTLQDDRDDQATPEKPKTIPFDRSMLDAAKEGSAFPYGKGKPADTSRIVDPMESSRSSVTQKSQVPMRHVKTFWDRDFADPENKLALRKQQMRLENIRAGRELQENLITTWNDEDDAFVDHEKLADFSRARIARRSVKIGGTPGDDSASSDSIEIPSRWSEFPYAKAIPFDPEKLRRPRSVTAPQHFPYAKAIPYDPWKLVAFRRKKSKTQKYAAIHV